MSKSLFPTDLRAEEIYYSGIKQFLTQELKNWKQNYIFEYNSSPSCEQLSNFIKNKTNKFLFRNDTVNKLVFDMNDNIFSDIDENIIIFPKFYCTMGGDQSYIQVMSNNVFDLWFNYVFFLLCLLQQKEKVIINCINHELQHIIYYYFNLKSLNSPNKINSKMDYLSTPVGTKIKLSIRDIVFDPYIYYNQKHEIIAYAAEIIYDIKCAIKNNRCANYLFKNKKNYVDFINILNIFSSSFKTYAENFGFIKNDKENKEYRFKFDLTSESKKLLLQLIYNTLEKEINN